MLITTFGPPAGYTQFCLHLMRFFVEEVLQDVDYVAADELSQLREAWTSRKHPHMLFFAHFPERALVEMFLRIRAPFIIFTEELEDITGYVMRERNQAWPWALRLTHQCVVTTSDLLGSEDALVLKREYELTFEEFFRAIANHFQLTVTAAHVSAIMSKAGMSPEFGLSTPLDTALIARWEHARPSRQGLASVPRAELRAMAQVNAPLKALIAGKDPGRIQWPSEMFISGDRQNEMLVGPIDMLGPARCLCYGPYLHLPIGEWNLALEMVVTDNFSGNHFDIDIVHRNVVALESFRIPAQGHFKVQTQFAVDDPRNPVEIRIVMREGAIEGVLDIKRATVEAVHRDHARAQPSSAAASGHAARD